jgi:hypothetical protein
MWIVGIGRIVAGLSQNSIELKWAVSKAEISGGN